MTLFHDPVLFHCAYKSSKVFDITESDSSLMQATHRQRSTSFKASGPKRNPFQDAYNDEMKTEFQRLKASEAHLHQTSLEGHPLPLPESGLNPFDGTLHVKCAQRGGGRGRYSTKFYTGRLHPEVHPLYPFIFKQ